MALTSSVPPVDVSKDVFTLNIEHGVHPKDGTYAYCIFPVTGAEREPFEVLANTEQLQAVQFGGKLVEAVFHTAGRLNDVSGRSVAVDAPCVAVFDWTDGALQATVADPTQTLRALGLELDGKKRVVQLPVGIEAGKSTK